MKQRLDQIERDKLIETLFDKQFFRKFNSKNDVSKLELIITADCNLKCEYCYIYQHGDKLYPKEFRNHKDIINNLDLVLKWILKNEYFIRELDLFSGEFFVGSLGFKVLDKIYEYAKKKKFCELITIPTNFYFISDNTLTEKVENNIKKFGEIGIDIVLSCSIDGEPIDKLSRASDSSYRNNSYYDKVFEFCKKHCYGYHPMVSTIFIDHYKENYSWWIDKIIEHYGDEAKYHKPMLLEVRNDGWTKEKISKYQDYLWFQFEYDLEKLYKNDIEAFAQDLFNPPMVMMGNPIKLPLPCDRITCSIQMNPAIRLGDLSLVPCHRLSYKNFIYGNFKVKNNEISGINELNTPLALKIYSMNPNVSHPRCSECLIKYICLRGCLGSQYETTGEIFMPIDSVCELMFTKMKTLKEIYDHYNMFNIMYKSKVISERRKEEIKIVEDMLCQLS